MKPRYLALARHLAWALALAAALAACRRDAAPPAAPAATAPAPAADVGAREAEPYRAGEIRFADRRVRTALLVGQVPRMDLETQCRHLFDDARREGYEEVHLCFDPDPRVAVRTLRVEHREGLRGAEAMAGLRRALEGAHFLVEASGNVYQLLDIAYAARRAGVYPRDEIRVISGSREAHEALAAELSGFLPGLRVEEVAFTAPPPIAIRPRTPAGPDAGPAAAPAAPPEPASPAAPPAAPAPPAASAPPAGEAPPAAPAPPAGGAP